LTITSELKINLVRELWVNAPLISLIGRNDFSTELEHV